MEMTMTADNTATNTAVIAAREAVLKEELRTALTNGEADKVIEARNELSQLPIQKRAHALAELKQGLKQIEALFDQNAKDEAGMIQIRDEIRPRLEQALDLVAAIGQEMSKVEFGLSLVYSQRQGLHEERREKKAAVSRIVKEINSEVGIDGLE
jgi:hypothetical protein